MADRGRQNGRGQGTGDGRQPPPQNPYAGYRTGGGRVPPLDAFEEMPKRKAPNLPVSGSAARPAGGRPGDRDAGQQGPQRRRGPKNGTEKAGRGTNARSTAAGQAKGRKKPKRKKRQMSQKKKRRRQKMAAIFAVILVIGAGIWFTMNVLFKVDSVTVEGASPYSDEEILAVFGLEEGDNLFSFTSGDRRQVLETQLPYLEAVRIHRKLPSRVVIEVVEATERYSVWLGDSWAVLSESMKVLRIADSAPEGATQLFGLTSLTLEPGSPIAINKEAAELEAAESEKKAEEVAAQQAAEPEPEPEEAPEVEPDQPDGGEGEGEGDGEGAEPETETPAEPEGEEGQPGEGEEGEPEEEETPEEEPQEAQQVQDTSGTWQTTPAERLAVLDLMLGRIEESGLALEDVDWINVSDMLDMQFRWQGRITIRLGARSSMAEKLRLAVVLLTDEEQDRIGDNERGTLDVSDPTTGRFLPEY